MTANASAHTMPPRKSEPVSPINTFAGWKFQTRKPRQPPATAALNAVTPSIKSVLEISIKETATKKVIEPSRPSTPSVRLTAFTMPTITIAERM